MSRRYTPLLIFAIIIQASAFAQKKGTIKVQKKEPGKDQMFVLKTDVVLPFVFLFNRHEENNTREQYVFTLVPECGFKKRHSIQLNLMFHQLLLTDHQGDYQKEQYLFIVPEYKFFWKAKRNFNGFYSSLYYAERYENYDYLNDYAQHIAYHDFWGGPGLGIGFQTSLKNNLTFDILAGYGVIYFQS
jgi:hypothetical protein